MKRRSFLGIVCVAPGAPPDRRPAFHCEGASNKVICRELGLAERTVKAHVTAVLRSLKVSSRTQAAIEAVRLALAEADR